MFIVTLNSFYGSSLEGSQPLRIFGPFETMDQAEDAEDYINEMLEELDERDVLAQAFEIDGKNLPQSINELKSLLGFEDYEPDENF